MVSLEGEVIKEFLTWNMDRKEGFIFSQTGIELVGWEVWGRQVEPDIS